MSHSDEDRATKQVLEYYKKYSQNPHLQKYFSGTDPISCTVLNDERATTPKNIPNIIITEGSTSISDVTEARIISVEDIYAPKHSKRSHSSSSEAANVKDEVLTSPLRRSNSLPTKLCQTEVYVDLSQLSSTENVKILVFGSSSSSDEGDKKLEAIVSSSTSSSAKAKTVSTGSSSNEDNKILSFGLTLSQLKETIGAPIAFSTPILAITEGILVDQGKDSTPKVGTKAQKNNQCLIVNLADKENVLDDFKPVEKRKMDKNESGSSSSKSESHKNDTCTYSNEEKEEIPFSQLPDSIYLSKQVKSKKMSLKVKKTGKTLHHSELVKIPKLPEKKTVELSISEPLNINCLCENKTEIAVQTDPNLSHDKNSIVEESSCDSFEYISSNIESSKKTAQIENRNSNVGESTNSTIERSSKSKYSDADGSEDVDKLVDVLQVLLLSNKNKIGRKKEHFKRIIQKILSSSESERPVSNSTSPVDHQETKTVNMVKHQRKQPESKEYSGQSGTDTSGQSVKKKEHLDLESLKKTSGSGSDYLLKFAENERMYQIAWIDNEISHLSKLKKFLESNKEHSTSSQVRNKKRHSTRYKVTGRDDKTNRELQRNFVIETDVAVPDDANINYVIDGKKFVVAQEEPPKTVKSSVIADIEVESKMSCTNIKICTLCSRCKQTKCMCQSESPIPTYSASASSAEGNESDKMTKNGFKLHQDLPTNNLNSLEKVFQTCDCKTAHSDHTCPFVQKLTKHFSRYANDKATTNVSVQAVEDQPEKLHKEVQAKVETLDRQIQNLKTLIEKQTNERKYHPGTVDRKETPPTSSLKKKVQDIQDCLRRPRSNSLDKMIQTDENQKKCDRGESKLVQTDNAEGMNIRMTQDKAGSLPKLGNNTINQIQTEKDVTGNQHDTEQIKIIDVLHEDVDIHGNRDEMEGDEKSRTMEGTSATYSQHGSTSLSVPTSILDNAQPTIQTCACCGRSFPQETDFDNLKNNLIMCCCKKYTLAHCNNPLMRCYCHGQSCKTNNYYCICNKNQSHKYKTYCKRCRKKLMDTVKKQRQGMAYTLILEEKSVKEEKKDDDKGKKYDEVRMQIPKVDSSKKYKDRRNSYERNKFDSLRQQEPVQDKDKGQENKRQYTLKEYLIENRPEFIYTAEYRRQLMLNSRISREQRKDALKVNFLDSRVPTTGGNVKLYSEREMKEITRRNYDKLPEVLQKQVNRYEKRLRDADRVICDRFARKIQRSVLKGKSNFPIDKNVINL